MKRENEDIRVEVVKKGLTYREIAREMRITPEWLSRVLARRLTSTMRQRIDKAIDKCGRR